MKLQINRKVTNAKSASFAVIDSLNYYIKPDSLKDLNVLKLADKIVMETRREFGEQFTKAQLEQTLNKTIKSMTTTAAKSKAAKPAAQKKEVELTDEDRKIIESTDSLNKRVALLPHLWGHQAVLAKAFSKSRQRIINAIKLAKAKQGK